MKKLFSVYLFVYILHFDAQAQYETENIIRIFRLPPQAEQEKIIKDSHKLFDGMLTPLEADAEAVFLQHEKKFIDFFISTLPEHIRESIDNLYKHHVEFQNEWDVASRYDDSSKSIFVIIPRAFQNNGLGAFLLVHELVHAAQDALNEFVEEDKTDKESYRVAKKLFQMEKTAMDWEWLYLQTLPKRIREALVEELGQANKSRYIGYKAKEAIHFYKTVLSASHEDRISYLKTNWDHLLRYSPSMFYRNTGRYSFKNSLFRFIKDEFKDACKRAWLKYQILSQ